MARLKMELPTELIKQYGTLEKTSEEVFGKMSKAGAEVVYKNIKSNMGNAFKGDTKSKMEAGLKITKTYKSPKKGSIGNFVGFYGYIPFSDSNRKYFARRGANGTVYKTEKGVPRDFLAQLYEYGSNEKGISGSRFIKKSCNKKEVEQAMQDVLDKEIEKVIK